MDALKRQMNNIMHPEQSEYLKQTSWKHKTCSFFDHAEQQLII